MKISIYILILLIFGCRPNNQNKVDDPISTKWLDSPDITVFATDSMKNGIFANEDKIIKLDKSEILECEKILKDYVNRYNLIGANKLDSMKRFFRDVKHKNIQLYEKQLFIDLKNYGRQYLGVLSRTMHKIVYLNCFDNPSEFNYRQKDWVIVLDGGNCFFQMKIDLTDKKVIEYSENGKA